MLPPPDPLRQRRDLRRELHLAGAAASCSASAIIARPASALRRLRVAEGAAHVREQLPLRGLAALGVDEVKTPGPSASKATRSARRSMVFAISHLS
jgi:hypothetical protein